MSKTWKQYQEEAASFFRSLGFEAQVDQTLVGVRGQHNIDVWVTGEIQGISFKWIVECKFWKNNIPKEKVLALISIVQDIGADRGFLLSEVGFQSGAIRNSLGTNISLTSIADLKEETKTKVGDFLASKLHWRIIHIKKQLFRLHKQTDDYFSKYLEAIGKVTFLDMAIEDAIKGNFPIVYGITQDRRLTAIDWEDLNKKASEILDESEALAGDNPINNIGE